MLKHLIQLAIAGFLVSQGAAASQDRPPPMSTELQSAIEDCAKTVGIAPPPAPFDESKKTEMDSCLQEHGIQPPHRGD